ncbi:MAG: YDG domain-containing protein, partial [Burkholderiaceae bacterium]
SASITPLALVVTGLTALDKVYDTTTVAQLAGTASVSPIPGDAIALSGSNVGSFADKNVGTAKPVTPSGYSLVGSDAPNYTLTQPAGLSASISPASLTV